MLLLLNILFSFAILILNTHSAPIEVQECEPCIKEFFKQTYAAQNWKDNTSCLENYSFLDSNLTKRYEEYIKGESCFLNFVNDTCTGSNFEYFSRNYKTFAETMSVQPENSTCLDPHFQLNGLRCKGMTKELNAEVGFVYEEIVDKNDTCFIYVTKLCREVQKCMQESCTYGDSETEKIKKQCGLLELAGSNFGRCISKMRIEKPDISMFECMKGIDFYSQEPSVACQKFKTNRKCTTEVMKNVCGEEAVEEFETSADTIVDYFNCE